MRISRILPVLAVTAATITPSAASLYFNGAYAGVGFSGLFIHGKHRYNDNSATGQSSSKSRKVAPAFSGYLGIMSEVGLSTFVAGAELFINKPIAKVSRTVSSPGTPPTPLKMQRRMGYGPAIILGKLLNPKTVFYGRLGYEFSKAENRFVPGLGMKYALADRFHIGLEYGLAAIGKKETRISSSNVSNKYAIQSKFLEHRIELKLSYQLFSPLSR